MISNNQIIERRYDIDWLRVITIGLLLIYHIAIVFQPWGIYIGFIQSSESMEGLWVPMTMLNVWRIPLLFFVSGMGLSFAMRKRNIKQLLKERTMRILLPFVFGVLCIVPLHTMIWERYYEQKIDLLFNPSHLWFLGNIFLYVVILLPLLNQLINNQNGKISELIKKVFSNPISLLLVAVCFVLEAVILAPNQFELYAMTWHGFILGFLSFLFGICFVFLGNNFWEYLLKWKWAFLILGLMLYFTRLLFFELKAPNYLLAIESIAWIYTVFGFAYRYLNNPNRVLAYLSQGAYPIYITHMFFLYLGSVIILPLSLPVFVKFLLVILFTFSGCFLSYEFLIRRVKYIRPLFGLKM